MNGQILYVSWCNDNGHDKIWGYFCLDNDQYPVVWNKPVFVFWGARGKALQLKQHTISDALYALLRNKERKGYKEIDVTEFEKICPNFHEEVDNKITFAILGANKYKAVV